MEDEGSSFNLETKSPDKAYLGDSRLSELNTTIPFKSPTYENEFGLLDCQVNSNVDSDPEECGPIHPSNQIIPSGFHTLVSAQETVGDVSWTSSMATPLSKNVTYSNLNTDERRVFLPSDNCATTVKRRALFTPDLNDTTCSYDEETPRTQKATKSNGRSLLAYQLDNSFRSNLGSFSFCSPKVQVKENTEEMNIDGQSAKRKSTEVVSPIISKKRLKSRRNIVIGSPETKTDESNNRTTRSVDMFNDSEDDIFSDFETASSTPSRSASGKSGNYAESTPSMSRSRASSTSIEKTLSETSKLEDKENLKIESECTDLERTFVENPKASEWSPDDSFSEAMVNFTSFQDSPVSQLKSRVQSIKKACLNPSVLYAGTSPLTMNATTAEVILKSMALQGKYSDSQPAKISTLTNVVQQKLVPFSQIQTKKELSTFGGRQPIPVKNQTDNSHSIGSLTQDKLNSNLPWRDVPNKNTSPPEETSILTDLQLIEAGEEAEMLMLLENEEDWLQSKLEGADRKGSDETHLPKVIKEKIPGNCDDGFRTASGREVLVSQDALNRASKLFADIDSTQNKESDPTFDSTTCDDSQEGFSTASGKKVLVSQEALSKAHRLLAQVDEENKLSRDFVEENGDTPSKLGRGSFSGGFKTANGDDIIVSQEALNKVSKLFADVEDDLTNTENGCSSTKRKLDSLEKTDDVGFVTASGRPVQVSEEALQKVKNLFEEESEGEISKKIIPVACEMKEEIQAVTEDDCSSKKRKFDSLEEADDVGFVTASGRPVQVSEEALQKVKKLFEEGDGEISKKIKSVCKMEEEIEAVTEPRATLEDLCVEITNMDDSGLATTGGKNLVVSEKAVEKKKKFCDDEDLMEKDFATSAANRRGHSCELAEKTVEGVFVTASGKKVTVSNSALDEARKLLADEFSTEEGSAEVVAKSASHKVADANSSVSIREGFLTARGNKIAISNSALEKARKLCADDSSVGEDFPALLVKSRNRKAIVKREPGEMSGIITDKYGVVESTSTSERTNIVSEESIRKVRDVFPEEENISSSCVSFSNTEDLGRISVDSEFKDVGFATARGKSVSVSEESLKKARALFQDIMESETIKNDNFEIQDLHRKATLRQSPLTTSVSHCQPTLEEKVHVISPTVYRNSAGSEDRASKKVENDAFKVPFSVKKSPKTAASALDSLESGFSGVFATASGKNVQVSEEALRKAKVFFEDTDGGGNGDKLVKKETVGTTECNGFSTASGKTVTISEESVKKISHLFDEKDSAEEYLASYKLSLSQASKGKPSSLNQVARSPTNSHDISSDQCNRTTNRTLSQEISESTAAFLADESENSPTFATSRLIEPIVSQPTGSQDRTNAPEPVTTFPEECSPIAAPGSPILGKRPNGPQKKVRRKVVGRLSLSTSLSGKSTTQESVKKAEPANISLPVRLAESGSTLPVNDQRKVWEDEEDDEMLTSIEIDEVILEVTGMTEEEEQLGVGRELRPEVSKARKMAAEEQEKVVRAGIAGKKGPRMAKGSLFAKKTASPNCRRSLKSYVGSTVPGPANLSELRRLGVDQRVWYINSEIAANFRFNAWQYYSADICRENVFGLPVGDGARLILNDEGTVGVPEFERAFLASASVDPALVPSGWVRNHYRWIVWKLASLERRFPKQFARVLTPHVVMQQLKYRYDREIDRCQRPALRRILEHDDSPARRMVMCVASIKTIEGETGTSQVELELTDGWYSVLAVIDVELQNRVLKGRLTTGTKIVTHGAELVNCPQGCPPLEISPDVRLKITANSTRRARWYAKLGFQRDPRPFVIPLSSILTNGGMVGCVNVYIAKVYPLVYLEKNDKARTIVRSERAERKESAMAEARRQRAAEQMYVQAQAEVHKQQLNDQSNPKKTKTHITRHLVAGISSAQELCSLMESAVDPVAFENMLSDEQKQMLVDIQREKQENLCREVQSKVKQRLEDKSIPQRNVTSILKVRLVDGSNPDMECSAVLSIWNPVEEMASLFKETQLTTIYSVAVNGWRCGTLQLSATRSTQYKEAPPRKGGIPPNLARSLTTFTDLYTRKWSPAFGEVDVVGVVVRVDQLPVPSASNQNLTPGKIGSHYQTVYFADEEQNILGVSFWGGLKEFGVDDIVSEGVSLSMSNLQWRGGSLQGPISLYAQEVSVFTTNPRLPQLRDALHILQKTVKLGVKSFVQSCTEKLEELLKSGTPYKIALRVNGAVRSSSPTDGASTPKVSDKMASSGMRTSTPIQQPPLTGDLKQYSPGVQERIKKLEMYGNASPLPPLVMAQRRTSLRRGFRPPRRALAISVNKVTSTDSDDGNATV